jgi:murein DD-endopeptidase MepM/ murein hydrolase activator NlpD
LKPEIKQKFKSVIFLKTHQNVLADRSSSTQPSLRRSRGSVMMTMGLSISMAISSFPVNCPVTVATAAELAPTNVSNYVRQQKEDLAIVRAQNRRSKTILIGQSLPAQSATNLNDKSQFTGEVVLPILVPEPKNKTFKPVANIQNYLPNGDDADTELFLPGDKPSNGKAGSTSLAYGWPTTGVLTSRFGRRWGKMHKGIDIAGPVGTPINSAADGVVVFAGWQSGYGNLVEIKHADGTTTRYGHNHRLLVSVGQTVAQGQQVSEMGSTGHSTGSHLHFEIRPNGGDAVNPIAHLPKLA